MQQPPLASCLIMTVRGMRARIPCNAGPWLQRGKPWVSKGTCSIAAGNSNAFRYLCGIQHARPVHKLPRGSANWPVNPHLPAAIVSTLSA